MNTSNFSNSVMSARTSRGILGEEHGWKQESCGKMQFSRNRNWDFTPAHESERRASLIPSDLTGLMVPKGLFGDRWGNLRTLLLDPTEGLLTLRPVKILFIGDIVGEPGRKAVKALVPLLRVQHGIDAVVANAENAAGGSGITPKTAEEVFSARIDALTMGDHLWDQKEVAALLESEPRFLRPLNYPPGTVGQGSRVFRLEGKPPFGVVNAQGRTFMADLDNPFAVVPAEVARMRAEVKVILVDFHAEATSEKIALARLLDGQVSAFIGTHTHVQTADEQIFPGGTAFLCDAGFTGPHESVLGREIAPVIKRFQTQVPQRFEVARNKVLLQGALIDVDETTGQARQIKRISELLP